MLGRSTSFASEGDWISLQRQSAKVSEMEEELWGGREGQIPRGENIRAPREDSLLPSFVRLHREEKEKVGGIVGALERLTRLRFTRTFLAIQ